MSMVISHLQYLEQAQWSFVSKLSVRLKLTVPSHIVFCKTPTRTCNFHKICLPYSSTCTIKAQNQMPLCPKKLVHCYQNYFMCLSTSALSRSIPNIFNRILEHNKSLGWQSLPLLLSWSGVFNSNLNLQKPRLKFWTLSIWILYRTSNRHDIVHGLEPVQWGNHPQKAPFTSFYDL